jgi:hypothetical protein
VRSRGDTAELLPGRRTHDSRALERRGTKPSNLPLTATAGPSIMSWCRKEVKRLLKRLRTIPGFIRLLVGLFLVAQFAGVVSSPRASALPVAAAAVASHDHNQHALDSVDHGKRHHHHDSGALADTCCGLHACFAGVVPPLAGVQTECMIGEPIAAGADDLTLGLSGSRLDRPPRPLH